MALGDFAVFLILGMVIYWIFSILSDNTTLVNEKRTITIGLVGLTLSIATVYLTTVRPFFRKPRLAIEFNIQWSEATADNDSGSWFFRIRIENYGLTRSEKCIGRLIDVWTKEGKQITKFDPLTLYWSRQSEVEIENKKTNTFKPIDIQGYNDFDFLDLAQVKNKTLFLRVVIPPNTPLKQEQEDSPSPGNLPILKLPGTYYARIGLYAGEVFLSPFIVKILCTDISNPIPSEYSPCELKLVRKIPRQ